MAPTNFTLAQFCKWYAEQSVKYPWFAEIIEEFAQRFFNEDYKINPDEVQSRVTFLRRLFPKFTWKTCSPVYRDSYRFYTTLLYLSGHLSDKKVDAMWKPIETAPKDGTSILVSDGYSVDQVEWETRIYDQGQWLAICSKRKAGDALGYEPIEWMELPKPSKRS